MFKVGANVYYIREIRDTYWLVDDNTPELAIKLPNCKTFRQAEQLAWLLIND